jgi:hypothetical protein
MISAKLQLHTDPEQFQALRTTQLAYKDALNAVSRYAFAHGKTSNNLALHRPRDAQRGVDELVAEGGKESQPEETSGVPACRE